MAGALRQLRPRVALSDISNDLGLPERAVRELRNLGIRSAEDFLGLIYAAFGDLVNELEISPEELRRIGSQLREYIDPYTLEAIEETNRTNETFSTGAELGPVRNRDQIPEYEEE